MKDDSAVVTSTGQLDKIVDRERSFFGEQLNRKRTSGSCHNCTNSFPDSCERALVVGCSVSGLNRSNLSSEITYSVCLQSSCGSLSQQAIPGVGDQAFYMSNAAYGRRGDVGIEVVEFSSKDLEIELLKAAVARLP